MEVWVNGRYQPLGSPAVFARDRGFLHGEAVYEGVKVVGRRPLFLAAHLERLAGSARAIGLDAPWEEAFLRPILTRLLAGLGAADAMARLYVTRGPDGGDPGALAWMEPLPAASLSGTPPWRLTCHTERVVPYLPSVKHTSRLAHARARRQSREAGADDALLIHADGWVLEGTASNVFFFEADTLHTPEPGCGILHGITRDVVLELAPGCGFKTVEGRYPAPVVGAADECFVTFTSAGIKPVGTLDGQEFPRPVPGPRTMRLGAAYDAHVAEVLDRTPPL